jgi:hypothetical protein
MTMCAAMSLQCWMPSRLRLRPLLKRRRRPQQRRQRKQQRRRRRRHQGRAAHCRRSAKRRRCRAPLRRGPAALLAVAPLLRWLHRHKVQLTGTLWVLKIYFLDYLYMLSPTYTRFQYCYTRSILGLLIAKTISITEYKELMQIHVESQRLDAEARQQSSSAYSSGSALISSRSNSVDPVGSACGALPPSNFFLGEYGM